MTLSEKQMSFKKFWSLFMQDIISTAKLYRCSKSYICNCCAFWNLYALNHKLVCKMLCDIDHGMCYSRDTLQMDVNGLQPNISWMAATVSFEVCFRPLLFCFSILQVSINVYKHCIMEFTGGGCFPYFIQYFYCTVTRSFYSISCIMHWTFSWKDAIVLKQKTEVAF